MTIKQQNLMNVEKDMLQSKKFVAWLLSELLITGILVSALFSQPFTIQMSFFMCIGILSFATISIGYVLSQAALDKFLTTIKDLRTGDHDDEPKTNTETSSSDSGIDQ